MADEKPRVGDGAPPLRKNIPTQRDRAMPAGFDAAMAEMRSNLPEPGAVARAAEAEAGEEYHAQEPGETTVTLPSGAVATIKPFDGEAWLDAQMMAMDLSKGEQRKLYKFTVLGLITLTVRINGRALTIDTARKMPGPDMMELQGRVLGTGNFTSQTPMGSPPSSNTDSSPLN